MSLRSTIRSVRRPALVGAAAITALAVGAAPAMAHHCYVPMYSLSGPTSPNWFVIDAETGRARQLTRGAAARMPAWSPPLVAGP